MSDLVAQSRNGRERAMAIPEGAYIGNVTGFINAYINTSETILQPGITPPLILGLQTMSQFLLNNKVRKAAGCRLFFFWCCVLLFVVM